MKDYTKVGREPPVLDVEEKQHWSKRAMIGFLLILLFFMPKRWKTWLAAQASTIPFWSGWFISDKVTWAQSIAFFKGGEIAAWWGKHIAPVLSKIWDAVTDLWALFTNST